MTQDKRLKELESQVLISKLRPPHLRYVLERPRLLERTVLSGNEKLLLICAGAGYGKTTLMAQAAKNFPGSYLWYQIDELDNDPAIFLKHLIYGLSQLVEGVGSGAVARLHCATDISSEIVDILITLLRDLEENSTTPTALCFDDFHLTENFAVSENLMNVIINNLPRHSVVFLSSRQMPKLGFSKIKARLMRKLGAFDLKFSVEEINDLLSDTWNLEVEDKDLSHLYLRTEGWPAGVVLLEDSLRIGDELPQIFLEQQIQRNVYEYLAEEVLGRQSEEMQTLLEVGSLIDPVDPELCRRAHNLRHAAPLMAAAEKMNLFINKLNEMNLYRYHPLFREYLNSRMQEKYGDEEIKRLRTKFASVYEAQGQKKEAVEQYLLSDQNKAIGIVEEIAKGMIDQGEYVSLENWFKKFSIMTPVLRVYEGILKFLSGETRSAIVILKSVEDSIYDEDVLSLCIYTIAECLTSIGEMENAALEIIEFLSLPLNDRLRAEAYLRLAMCHWRSGQNKEFSETIDVAQKINDKVFSTEIHYRIKGILTLNNLQSGDFVAASQNLYDLLNSNQLNENELILHRNNLASCLTMMAQYDKAHELLHECRSQAQINNEAKYLPFINDTQATLLASSGKLIEAKVQLSETIDYLTEKSLGTSEICVLHCHLGTMERRSGEYDRAFMHHQRGCELAESSQRVYDVVMCMINLGADSTRLGKLDEASVYFNKAKKVATEKGFLYALTHIDFHNAYLSFLTDKEETAIRQLQRAFERANKYQQNHFIIQEGKISFQILQKGIDQEIETGYLFWILEGVGIASIDIIKNLMKSEKKGIKLRCLKYFQTVYEPKAINLIRTLQRDTDVEIRHNASRLMCKYREKDIKNFDLLTNRENQILEMISKGATNARISASLYISERTVKTHVTNIFRKLGLNNRLEAALFYQTFQNSKI